MKKKILFTLALITSMTQAYKGERCVDAAILSGIRSIQNVTADILGKVCTILIKVCNIQDCTPFPISQPMTVTESGSYCVSRNLTGNGTDPVLIIEAPSVCIDLACHIIDGNGANIAITANEDKFVIRNGCVTNAAEQLILLNAANQSTVDGVQFQGGGVGVGALNCCDVTVSNCQFRGATGSSIEFDNCNVGRVVDCGICESNGSRGILCTTSQGIFIDPTIIQNNNLSVAGIELFQSSGVVIEGLQISRNGFGTPPVLFTGILGDTTDDVKILNPSIYDLRATTSLRGIDSLSQDNWTIKCASISDLAITTSGAIDGIRTGGNSFVDSCSLSNFSSPDNTITQINGIVTGANSTYTNNLVSNLMNNGDAGTALNGFNSESFSPFFSTNVQIEDNTVVNLVRGGAAAGSGTSAAYLINGVRNSVNRNIANEFNGINGFLVDTIGNQNSLFANQAQFDALGAYIGAFNDGAESLVTYTVTTGLYNFPPLATSNIQIVT